MGNRSVGHKVLVIGGAPNIPSSPIKSSGGLCSGSPTPWKTPVKNPPEKLPDMDIYNKD